LTSLSPLKVSPFADVRKFALVLAILLGALIGANRPNQSGDFIEYAVTTIAIAAHGTPDLRASDARAAYELGPVADFGAPFAGLEKGIREGLEIPMYGFNRGRNGDTFAIHFFGYSALAAIPFKLLQLAGLPPYKSFQIVNLGFIFILGLALFRLFGCARRAMLGVCLFMLCGGVLYWNWCSPEAMTAAALLAGLIYFSTGAPLVGGLLAGLAAMQNPPVVLFFGFAPLLHFCQHYQSGAGLVANLKRSLAPRYLLGMAIAAALFASAPLFSLWQFGVPSLIAKYSARVELIDLERLHSFFLDLSHGMIIGIPGLLAALGIWAWRKQPRGRRGRGLAVLAASAAFTLALAVPALAALNWNSGATGMLRYAFWSAMPLLFAFLWFLRQSLRWPAMFLLALVLVQAVSMRLALSYGYTEFSPLAKLVLSYAPGLYNPEPEVFFERAKNAEAVMDTAAFASFQRDGVPLKTVYNRHNAQIDATLCGPGQMLSPENSYVKVRGDWRYINGPLRCGAAGASRPVKLFGVEQFIAQRSLKLDSGWSGPEVGGADWSGTWSNGSYSRVTIALGRAPRHVSLLGHYFKGNERTRVKLNGVDMGWQKLDTMPILDVPLAKGAQPTTLTIELEHEAPYIPAPQEANQRRIAFFLRTISVN